jgi:DNA-3-methyladenine glycosylase II
MIASPLISGRDVLKEEGNPIVTYTLNSAPVCHLRNCDEALRLIIDNIGDLTYSPRADCFAFVIDTIVGQMLSNKVADILSIRIQKLCGGEVTADNIGTLTVSDLRGIGLSFAKAKYILGFADSVRENPDLFSILAGKPDDEVFSQLTQFHGLGSWSAKMYLIFVLNRIDVLPYEDGAFRRSFSWLYPDIPLKNKAIETQCAVWRPYASIASRYLYRALDSGLTQKRLTLISDHS